MQKKRDNLHISIPFVPNSGKLGQKYEPLGCTCRHKLTYSPVPHGKRLPIKHIQTPSASFREIQERETDKYPEPEQLRRNTGNATAVPGNRIRIRPDKVGETRGSHLWKRILISRQKINQPLSRLDNGNPP